MERRRREEGRKRERKERGRDVREGEREKRNDKKC